jgi:hypothetical protein
MSRIADIEEMEDFIVAAGLSAAVEEARSDCAEYRFHEPAWAWAADFDQLPPFMPPIHRVSYFADLKPRPSWRKSLGLTRERALKVWFQEPLVAIAARAGENK